MDNETDLVEFEDLPAEPAPAPRLNPKVSIGLLAAVAILLLGGVGYVIAEIEQPSAPVPPVEPASAENAAPVEKIILDLPRDRFERRSIPSDDFASQPTEEPAIFFPEAKEADHNEAPKYQMGDSQAFLSYIKGEGGRPSGVYDILGVGGGGGGGGRYGGRYGGRENAPAYFKPDEEAARAREAVRASAKRPEDRVASLDRKGPAARPQEAPRQSRKVIRSGDMEFEIDSFDTAVSTVTKIAVEEQGFVATINSEKLQNGKVRGTVVVRVPPERLDTLLLKLRALGELRSQRIGSEDVTKHYLDLESRLRAARTMEERLIKIIQEGKGEIKDLLQAEKELGEWRTRIETLVGEINYYNNLIAHSTLTITLYEKELRAPFGLVETERVEMGVEVEDVEKAHRDAIAAVAEVKGRVTKSELKQLNAGQFNAIVQAEVPPAQAGALRDRLKQLGVLARLDIHRAQETLGGAGKPQEAKVHQNDTLFLVSIYNLANIAPRETVHLNLACVDAEKSFAAILDRIEKAAGRIVASHLSRQRGDQTTGNLQFHIRAAEADAVSLAVRAEGEVMKVEVIREPETTSATPSKRGFSVNVYGLGSVLPRETSTVVLASKDVAAGYRGLLEAAKSLGGRIVAAQLNENDRTNMTATLSVELRREQEPAIAGAMDPAGAVYTRNSSRAQDGDNVVDSKILLHLRLFDAANIPARETVKLTLEVGDVEAAVRGLEADHKGRVVDARHSREPSGRRESALVIDVPLKELPAVVERIKGLGSVRDHVSAKKAGVPNNELAVARIEVKVASEVLVSHDSGPWANIRRGLAISLQAASWALMLIMIGLCFVLPLVLVIWAGLKLARRLRPKELPAS